MCPDVVGVVEVPHEGEGRHGKRPALAIESDATIVALRGEIGRALADARRRRRMTQDALARRTGLTRQIVSRIERGSVDVALEAVARVALAVDRPLTITLRRDPEAETEDAGHLAIQELVLRVGRGGGWGGSFELASRPAEPWRSIDVGLSSERLRRLIVIECWNTFGNVGAAVRSSHRKRAEADALAVAKWGVGGKASLVWAVRATAANRALVARYPEVFSRSFPGSSRRWVEALTKNTPPPDEPGLVWCDVAGTRLFAWRRRNR